MSEKIDKEEEFIFPQEDIEKFNYSEEELLKGK